MGRQQDRKGRRAPGAARAANWALLPAELGKLILDMLDQGEKKVLALVSRSHWQLVRRTWTRFHCHIVAAAELSSVSHAAAVAHLPALRTMQLCSDAEVPLRLSFRSLELPLIEALGLQVSEGNRGSCTWGTALHRCTSTGRPHWLGWC